MGQNHRCKVLFVVAGLPAGGAERQLVLLLRGLDHERFDPGLLIFNRPEKIHYRDVLDQPLWFRSLGLSGNRATLLLWPILAGINRAVSEFRPEVVFATLNVANHTTRMSRLVFGWKTPLVTSVRVGYRDGYSLREKVAERLLWRQSSAIVCNASTTRDEIVADIGIPLSRVDVVPNGVDRGYFEQSTATLPPWWPQGRVALTVARFSEQKNHLTLIEEISRIKQLGKLGEWRFVFVGEGPLEDRIRRAINAAELQDRILLRPTVSDLNPLYRAATLFVMPSRFEGMPNVVLEAQASGCPVAITAAANRAGVVAPGQGFTLGDNLCSLTAVLANSEQELAARGTAARRRIQAEFSVDGMVHRMEQILLRSAGAVPSADCAMVGCRG